MTTPPTLNYRDAGVNITAGDQLVERIKPFARRTHRPEVLGGLGGFGALFALPPNRYQEPVLVSGTDGVGTKLRLALALQQHQTIGIDLVAMCVNDVLVCGAEPLFFLDYYATGVLDVNVAAAVIEGIAHGCQQAGAALVGGETAEMPGMYHGDDYDLAGFCVGIVERSRIIDGSAVHVGDMLIALASSGPHSNGYSLIRKVIEVSHSALDQPFGESSLGTVLLTPTHIYVQAIRELLQHVHVHAMAHITGGGLTENIPRVLPAHTKAVINTASWTWPAIFPWLQEKGGIPTEEMRRTFNCGVGFVIAVSQEDVPHTLRLLQEAGETAWVIGHIAAHDDAPRVEYVGTVA